MKRSSCAADTCDHRGSSFSAMISAPDDSSFRGPGSRGARRRRGRGRAHRGADPDRARVFQRGHDEFAEEEEASTASDRRMNLGSCAAAICSGTRWIEPSGESQVEIRQAQGATNTVPSFIHAERAGARGEVREESRRNA